MYSNYSIYNYLNILFFQRKYLIFQKHIFLSLTFFYLEKLNKYPVPSGNDVILLYTDSLKANLFF